MERHSFKLRKGSREWQLARKIAEWVLARIDHMAGHDARFSQDHFFVQHHTSDMEGNEYEYTLFFFPTEQLLSGAELGEEAATHQVAVTCDYRHLPLRVALMGDNVLKRVKDAVLHHEMSKEI